MKKQITLLITILCIAGLLTACRFETVAEHESRLAGDRGALERESSDAFPSAVPPAPEPNAGASSQATGKNDSPKGSAKPALASTEKKGGQSSKSTQPAGKPPSTGAPAAPSQIQVSLSVTCKNALGNSSLKPGITLPGDGVILGDISLTLKSGQSVFDALKSACQKRNVYLGYQNSAYGTYVTGIGPLGERDCGRQSGWTYQVNGSVPSKNAAAYKLKNGDRVEWIYVIHA